MNNKTLKRGVATIAVGVVAIALVLLGSKVQAQDQATPGRGGSQVLGNGLHRALESPCHPIVPGPGRQPWSRERLHGRRPVPRRAGGAGG